MSTTLEHLSTQPVSLDQVPGPLRRHVDPKAPPPLRDMGAKGLVPGISPEHLALVLYQLHYDPEEGIKETAKKTFRELPLDMMKTMAKANNPAPVLDFCARQWIKRADVIEVLLTNGAVDDQTFAFVAGKGDERLCSVVADNQVRLLRTPLIIEQLYLNASTPQSNLDRILELAMREGVALEGFPTLNRAIKSIERENSAAGQVETGQAEEATFNSLIQEAAAEAEQEAEEAANDTSRPSRVDLSGRRDEPEKEEEESKGKSRSKNIQVEIQNMSISQRVRLATLGNKAARGYLVRDQNRLVHMAVMHSPRLTPHEMYDFAANKNLPEGVINYIASRKESIRDYQLLSRLVANPKLHLSTAMRMLNYLRPGDLKSLARNRNVSPQVAKAAKQLSSKRENKRR